MHKTVAESLALAQRARARRSRTCARVEVAVAPPFTALAAVANALDGTAVALAAQNCHCEESGAFTGEVSVAMLAELGVRYVILGHSERRQLFGETDELVAEEARARSQAAGLRPIVCVGETLAEREAGGTLDVLRAPARGRARGRRRRRGGRAGGRLRARVGDRHRPHRDPGAGAGGARLHPRPPGRPLRRERRPIRIQYGGCVKPDNAAELLGQPDIDGALVGGASLDPESFSAIIRSRERSAEVAGR